MTSALQAARAGDHDAFRDLTAPHLRELHVHCYRMLGSVDDADDVLQETPLAAWRGLDGYAQRSSFRVWLYRIATTRCLNAVRDGRRRPPPVPQPPFAPPGPSGHHPATWLQPYPDDPSTAAERRETIELAFITALQCLPPRQTAALLLCDVLGFKPAEAAELLGVGPTAVKGLLQRARAAMAPRPRPSRPDPGEEARLAAAFATAYAADDVTAVVELLTDDAWLAMPPAAHVYVGGAAIAAFLRASASWPGRGTPRLQRTRANTQPAYTVRLGNRPAGLIMLTVGDGAVTGITHFLHQIAPEFHPPRSDQTGHGSG
jgi:RNA polymerase sigma-70 factor (ECF subfamily)